MDLELLQKNITDEFKKTLDSVLETKLQTAIGAERSSIVSEVVQQLRLEKAMYGEDRTGLTTEEKVNFAKAVKSIALSQKANEALIPQDDSRGGYLVPAGVAQGILRIAASVGIVLSQAARWPMDKENELNVPSYSGSFLEGEYLGVDAAGTVTGLSFASAKLLIKEWQLAFAVNKRLLSVANEDVANWLLALSGEALANMVDKQGFIGTGAPFVGITQDTNVTVLTLPAGETTFDSFRVLDDASDMIANVEESVLQDAGFFMSRTVWAKLRVQKDDAGNYILPQAGALLTIQPRNGGPKPAGEIMGFPVYTCRHLPAFSATAISTKFIVFGSLKALAFGGSDQMRLSRYESGSFGGKEIALANQSALVFNNEHALTLALPAAICVAKTAAA